MNTETEYAEIDMYFSLDSTIYQVEERKVENILSSGVGFYFTNSDYGWCTGCYIYFLVDVIQDGRYYVQFTATPRSLTINSVQATDVMINVR